VLQPTQVKEDALSQVSQVDSSINLETVVVLFAIAAIFGLGGVVVIDSIRRHKMLKLKDASIPMGQVEEV
jgi:hypothetical protein